MSWMAADTLIDTPAGPRPMGTIKTGDRLLTRDHGIKTVRWTRHSRPDADSDDWPVRLMAPHFGLTRDLLLSPQTCVLLAGWEVELLFGTAEVLVRARYLVDGHRGTFDAAAARIRRSEVLFDQHEVLMVHGAGTESLFLGDHAAAASDIPATIRHSHSVRPVLNAGEAQVLLHRRALLVTGAEYQAALAA